MPVADLGASPLGAVISATVVPPLQWSRSLVAPTVRRFAATAPLVLCVAKTETIPGGSSGAVIGSHDQHLASAPKTATVLEHLQSAPMVATNVNGTTSDNPGAAVVWPRTPVGTLLTVE